MEEQIPVDSIVLHEWNIIPPKQEKVFCAPDAKRLEKKASAKNGPTITWTVGDIAKAACLLLTPPQKTSFCDEQEMRRVYTLIYDVFRYKSILNQALQDVTFYLIHPELVAEQSRVWLLLYDMYHRGFKKREVKQLPVATKLFAECRLTNVEAILWKERIKLAAAIARLRIEKSALKLSDLLPTHLRDEKINKQDVTPVTCWVNIRKTRNKTILCEEISNKLGLTLIESNLTIGPNHFKWDPHCPHFLILHPSIRTKLAQSHLVKKHKLIVQSKPFCVGPATFGKIIADLQLTGSVIQTHVNSPRTVAYLATLLSQNENIKKLMAFSAGNRKREYDNYFHDLGMKNILVYSEKLIDMSPDAHCLEEVIAVFATPPNSYTAVTDPIDLVCGRGGDLSMLEILTEYEETKQTRERVANILDEQRKTLRFAMSRPQIQFVLYETHSEIDAENTEMVKKAITEINRIAKLHHATLQGKIAPTPTDMVPTSESKEINNNEKLESTAPTSEEVKDSGLTVPADQQSITSKASVDEIDFDEKFHDVQVPDCDMFDLPDVPDLCPNVEEKCTSLNKEGCYLALLQRKVVTNMDNKYMIQMAEARGLFGVPNQASAKKSGRASKSKKKEEKPPSPTNKPKKKAKHIEKRTSVNTRTSYQEKLSPRISYKENIAPRSSYQQNAPAMGVIKESEEMLLNKVEPNSSREPSILSEKQLLSSEKQPTTSIKRPSSTVKRPLTPGYRPFTPGIRPVSRGKRPITPIDPFKSPTASFLIKTTINLNNNNKNKRKTKRPSIDRISIPTYSSILKKCDVEVKSKEIKCKQCDKRNPT